MDHVGLVEGSDDDAEYHADGALRYRGLREERNIKERRVHHMLNTTTCASHHMSRTLLLWAVTTA